MLKNKLFYRVKLLDQNNKSLWASINCATATTKFVVSSDLYNESSFDDYNDAINFINT